MPRDVRVVTGGKLPDGTTELLRVVYDGRSLVGTDSASLRKLDQQYETRQGDPQWFTLDKDGLLGLRVVPAADGAATYDEPDGTWGAQSYTDAADVGVEGGSRGIMRYRTDCFPSGGPWGAIARIHPTTHNIKVEIARLGRPLERAPFEIPDSYVKFVVFYAMAKAMQREGSGQDLDLAKHYMERFQLGITQISNMKRDIQRERVASMGGNLGDVGFGLGTPQLPAAYPSPRY